MNLTVNGKAITLENSNTLSEVIQALKFQTRSVAIALDGTFVPKEVWHVTNICDGADIEILSPMQGG